MSIEVPQIVKTTLATVLLGAALYGAIRYARSVPSAPPTRPAATVAPPLPARDVVLARPIPTPAAPDPIQPPPVTRESSGDLPQPSAAPLENVIEHAMPAVVMITTEKTRGSGFFVRPDLIVTNAHVVAGFLFVSVTTHDGTKITAKVAQLSDEFDLALVQIARLGPTDAQLPLGTSAAVRLGEGVVALGWAQGLRQSTVTRGIVTGLRKEGSRQLVQTDAVPNPGDSGGPLLNRAGEVVGVTTFYEVGASGSSGYALAIDDAKPFMARITSVVMTVPLTNGSKLGLSQAQPSSVDLERAAGTQQLGAMLVALAQRANALDASWNRYKAACGVTSVPPGYTREWFHLLDPRDPLHRAPEFCGTVMKDLERAASSITADMAAADEAARRTGVFPGTRRELRQRFRLDYPGWDR